MTEKRKKSIISNIKKKINPTYQIEADGCGSIASVLISGVVGIVEYSSEEVRLLLSRESIKISGFSLEIAVYERKSVEIMGEVSSLEIISKRKKGR